ncbi:MAG: porin [Methylotenera sp.]|nr:porin [Methylotenera sp.]
MKFLPFKQGWKLKCGVLLALCISNAYAAENAGNNTEDRIAKLQKMLEEQQWQMKAMAEELTALQQGRSNDKGKSKGSPVYAAFKDGLVFDDGSGDWKLQLNGRIQADYRSFSPDEWKNDGFFIRRARLGGTFSFLNDFALRVEGEYNNVSDGSKATTALTYGYLDYAKWKGAKIRVGQFKPTFGLERAQSSNFTDFTEQSLATNNGSIFNSSYDRGLMVFGDPLPWLNYNAYYVNGSGQNNDDIKDSKDIGARVNANLAQFTDRKNLVLHVGTSASKGSIDSSSTSKSIKQSTEGSGVEFFNIANIANTATNTSITDRTRFGLEAAVAYGPVKFQSEYIQANFEGKQGLAAPGVAYDNDIKTWYADINWLVTGEAYADAYKSGVFGRVKPKNNLDDKTGWGAFELGLRYSKFDASDFEAIKTADTATEADAWTVGAKWLFNPNARLVLNYIRTDFDNAIVVKNKREDSEQAVNLRAQYDF